MREVLPGFFFFSVLSYCSYHATDLLTSSQTMYRCSPMAQLTSSWRPALISGMAQTSTLSLALTGEPCLVTRLIELCTWLFKIVSYRFFFFLNRKKVLDFYQRACLSGYCSAFAYKPMQVALSSQLNGKCVELAPGPMLFSGVELPGTTPIKHSSHRNSWSSDGEREGELDLASF